MDENAYYVEVAENGKTYEVETEAGKGFINAAQTGNLHILKTSDDNVLQGFTFKVEGTDATGRQFYKEYVTDEKGRNPYRVARGRIHNFRIIKRGNGKNTFCRTRQRLRWKQIVPQAWNF